MIKPKDEEEGLTSRGNYVSVCVCTQCDACGPSCATKDEACIKWNSIPRPLKWSSEPPTEIGWYWNRTHRFPEEASILFLTRDKVNTIQKYRRGAADEWAGPILAPIDCLEE